jgi:CheY-like chemotaxis protein
MDKTRILVADDDQTTTQLLERILKKAGYDVILAADGNEAWRVLQRDDAPKVAILDWMMPGRTGVEVCGKLRETTEDIRTYVILATAKGKKKDIITALDAGADDYIIKPIDRGELLARLRVAERTLGLQHQLLKDIEELQSVLRRNNLLGEIVRNMRGSKLEDDLPVGEQDCTAETSGFSDRVAALGTMAQIGGILVDTLQNMGVCLSCADTSKKRVSSVFAGWSAVILQREGVWLDFKIETDRATASELYHTLTGKSANSDAELMDVLGELLSMTVENLRTAFSQEEIETAAPYLPRVKYRRQFSELPPTQGRCQRYDFSGSGLAINLSVIEQPARVAKKTVNRLRPLDVLVDAVYQRQADDMVLLLSEGIVLDMRYIQKLFDFLRSQKKDFQVSIIEPSPLTKIFNCS